MFELCAILYTFGRCSSEKSDHKLSSSRVLSSYCIFSILLYQSHNVVFDLVNVFFLVKIIINYDSNLLNVVSSFNWCIGSFKFQICFAVETLHILCCHINRGLISWYQYLNLFKSAFISCSEYSFFALCNKLVSCAEFTFFTYNNGPNMKPCDTPSLISNVLLKYFCTFTLTFLLVKHVKKNLFTFWLKE